MRIRPIRPGKGHGEARGGISRRGAAAKQARRKEPRLLWSKHKTSLPAIPDEAAREIWCQPEEQNVKQSPLIHSFPNVSPNTLPASSAFRPFKSAHQGGIETDSGCAAGTLARSLIGLRRCRSSAAMPAPEMFPRPKPEEACAPELCKTLLCLAPVCRLPLRSPFNANIPIILLCALERISPNGLVGGEAYIFAFLSFFMMSQTVLTFPAPMSSTVSPGRTFASR